MFLPNLVDRHGNKLWYFVAILVDTYSALILLSLPGKDYGYGEYLLPYITSIFFTYGLTTSVRATAGLSLMSDVFPKRYHPIMISFWLSAEALVHIAFTLYFQFVGNDWVKPNVWA